MTIPIPALASDMESTTNVLKSANKVFSILEHLEEHGGKTVTELATEFDIPKSTIQLYINTLYENQFVTKRGGQYELSLQFLKYGFTSLSTHPLFPAVKSKTEELAASTGELAACFVEEENEGVYIYGREGERSIRTDLSIGDRSPLHCTGSGKAILAELGEERIAEVIEIRGLEQRTPNTITDEAELHAELERIREQGYATAREESIGGMHSVAAPILVDGTVAGSVSLAGPATRFVGERFEAELPELVMGAANEIELRLTYSRSGV